MGLGDVGAGDLSMPRLSINHPEGTFKNSLSGEEFPVLRAVFLGLIKQRVYFHPKVDDGDKPMCKSPDFNSGFPNMNLDGKTPSDKVFPWAESNFDPANFPPEQGINGLVTLPCDKCVFKEWSKSGEPPPCTEQHTYPVLYQPEGEDGLQPALISFQKTGIKPSRTYLNNFVQARKPMFTVFTEVTLTQQSRGSVKYSVPTFRKKEDTDPNGWAEFGEMYRSARTFATRAPRLAEETDGEDPTLPSDNVNRGPSATAPATPTSPAPSTAAQPAPAATTSPAAPAAAAPAVNAPPSTVSSSTPTQQTTAPAQSAAQTVEQSSSSAETPSASPAEASQSATTEAPNDDLPF
jgi:hypothetical protein